MEYEVYSTTTLECGCKVDIDHHGTNGCCCDECYTWYDCDYDTGTMVKACSLHGG